jgi:hypothetical protein
MQASDDDLHDLPSEFDDDDLFLDESIDTNGDMEFLRSAAKNLMSSLAEMEAASSNMNTMDAPHSLLYGDDYVVTIKSRRFALAFLDYTQFRVEKQRNPDKFRLLAALKKSSNNINQKKRADNKQRDDTPSPTPAIGPDLLAAIETKSNKKKRNKRNKKKKIINHNNHDNKGSGLTLTESFRLIIKFLFHLKINLNQHLIQQMKKKMKMKMKMIIQFMFLMIKHLVKPIFLLNDYHMFISMMILNRVLS